MTKSSAVRVLAAAATVCCAAVSAIAGDAAAEAPRLLAGSIDALGVNGVGLACGKRAIGFRAIALLPKYGYVDGHYLFANLTRLGPYDPDGGYSRTEWAVPLTKEAVRRSLRQELYGSNSITVPDFAESEAAKVRLEWSFDGTDCMARVSADKATEVMLLVNGNVERAKVERGDATGAVLAQGDFRVAFAWQGDVRGGFVTADGPGEAEAAVRGLCASFPKRLKAGAIRLVVSPERPAFVTLRPGETARTVDAAAIEARLAAGERAWTARAMTSAGSAAGCADAVQRLVGFCATYDPVLGTRIIPVNRDWSVANGRSPTFMWDNFFDSYLACYASPELAKESLSHIVGVIAQKGMQGAPPQRNLIVPIVYSKLVRTVGDRDFARRTLPVMMDYIRFWFADRGDGRPWRDGNDDGLIESGTCRRPGGNAELGAIVTDAFDETGYDDSPMYSAGFGHRRWGLCADGVEFDFDRGTINLTLVGQNCLYVVACRSLAVVADELECAEDAAFLRREADRVAGRIHARLYNPATGIFQNRFFDGRFQGVLTPDTFTPLAAGVADAATAARLKAILTDPKKFWGENPVPTVSYDDPSFGDCLRPGSDGYWKGNYWRGNVWPSTDYIVYTALRATDWSDVRGEYVRRCRRLFMDDWQAHHHANENYPPFGRTEKTHMFAGNGGRDPHYIWSGLLPLQALEELFSVEDTSAGIRFGAVEPATFGSWTGFRYHGQVGRVSADAHGVKLELGDRLAVTTSRPAAFRRFVADGKGARGEVRAPTGAEVTVVLGGRRLTQSVPPSESFQAFSVGER